MDFSVLVIGFIISVLISACACRLILRWQVLDVPNERSSHQQPMPTLGGVGMLVGSGIPLGFGGIFFGISPIVTILLMSSVVLCVLIYDEIRPLGRLVKLIIQCITATIVIHGGLVLHHIELPLVGEWQLSWAAIPATFVWLVFLQNIYNFMDGLDGLAGVEGMFVVSFSAVLAFFFAPGLLPVCLVVTGSTLGFLLFNFPPARIFMGDVGSHFLGLVLGVIAICGEQEGIPFWVIALCLGAFLYDGTYTLLRRLIRGENITQAHQFHLYQRLVQMGWTPRFVLGVYGGVTSLLGAVGGGYMFEYKQWALGLGIVILIVIMMGTVWIEKKWQN